jgi:hypothetical protein
MKPFEEFSVRSREQHFNYSAPEVVEYGLVIRLTEG